MYFPLLRVICTLILLQGCNSAHPILHGDPGEVDVLVFSSTDCPVANALAPAIERLHQEVMQGGGQLYLVHVWEGRTHKDVDSHAKEYGLTMEIKLDPKHKLVKQFNATVTPEAVVIEYDNFGNPQVVYQGLLNNLFVSPGNRRDRATEHYVSDAIQAIIEGEAVHPNYRVPTGCLIEQMQ